MPLALLRKLWLIPLLLLAAWLGARACSAWRSGLGSWQGLTQAQLELRVQQFVSGIPHLEESMRLSVATLDIVKGVSAESRKIQFGIDWGTTKVSLTVPARVHYALDLSGRSPVEFQIDEGERRFTAVFPDPEVQAVEVFSKERKTYVEVGWGRFRSRSGQALADQLERGLYDAVKSEASAPTALGAVRERARPALARFVAVYLKNVGGWEPRGGFKDIAVRFRSEGPGEPQAVFTLEAASRGR